MMKCSFHSMLMIYSVFFIFKAIFWNAKVVIFFFMCVSAGVALTELDAEAFGGVYKAAVGVDEVLGADGLFERHGYDVGMTVGNHLTVVATDDLFHGANAEL